MWERTAKNGLFAEGPLDSQEGYSALLADALRCLSLDFCFLVVIKESELDVNDGVALELNHLYAPPLSMPNKGGLTDREAAIDALHRFLWALDEGNDTLSASSLTLDAVMVLQFTHNGAKPREVLGRETIVELLMSAVGRPLDTTHMATNVRCEVEGNEAKLQAQILAQHFRGGEGLGPEFGDYYLFGNIYKCDIERADHGLWKISRVTIKAAWTQGNPEVMKV